VRAERKRHFSGARTKQWPDEGHRRGPHLHPDPRGNERGERHREDQHRDWYLQTQRAAKEPTAGELPT
jgi:hypothetical protein